MVSVRAGLQQVKDKCNHLIPVEAVDALCQGIGYRFRQRLLGPAETVCLFLLQVLHGNIAISALRHQASADVAPDAYCRARTRLPLDLFAHLLRWACDTMNLRGAEDDCLWFGHRTFLIDGSSFSMPDTADLQAAFGQPGGQRAGCGFPVAKVLALFHAGTGAILDILATPLRVHEMSQIEATHQHLQAGDVLVADRGFSAYVHLALLSIRNVYAVFRAHQRTIVNFEPGRDWVHPRTKKTPKGLPRSRQVQVLGQSDQIVEQFRPRSRPKWMSRSRFEELPESLHVRELAYRIGAPGYRTREIILVTTLLDPAAYPAEELARLYLRRWQVEVNLRNLKITMGMDVLRCKTREGVLKEMHMFAIAYNLVCGVMLDAAARQGVPVDRISFIDALRWLRAWEPGGELIRLLVNPVRPGRIHPRARKRRAKNYRLLRVSRWEYRKLFIEQTDAA